MRQTSVTGVATKLKPPEISFVAAKEPPPHPPKKEEDGEEEKAREEQGQRDITEAEG